MTQYVVLLKNAKEQDIINMCEHQINDYVEACLNAKKRLATVTLSVAREYAATIRSGFDAKIAFSDPRNLFLTRSGFSRGLIGIDVPNPDRDNRRQEEAEQYSAAVNKDWAAIVNADNMALKTARENIVPASEAEHILDWIEDEWSELTAEKKLQVIRLIKLTYFNSYNLYNQFILRYLPGRTLLNRLNLARA